MFGICCPGCGLTRGFIAILQMDFIKATELNVFSIPLFVAVSCYSILSVYDVFYSRNCINKLENFLSKKYMYPIYFMLLIMGYFYNNM